MSWLGLLMLAIGLYLAWKLVGALLKLLAILVAIVGLYWFAAPHLGLPTVSDLVYVLGPDMDGKRIEEVLEPSEVARRASDYVIDRALERVGSSGAEAASPSPDALPEPIVEEAPLPSPPVR